MHWGSRPTTRGPTSQTWPETRATLRLPRDTPIDRGYFKLPHYICWPWLHAGGIPPDDPHLVWMGYLGVQIIGTYHPRITMIFPGWLKSRLHGINQALPHLLLPRITTGWLPEGIGPRHFALYLPIPENLQPPS